MKRLVLTMFAAVLVLSTMTLNAQTPDRKIKSIKLSPDVEKMYREQLSSMQSKSQNSLQSNGMQRVYPVKKLTEKDIEVLMNNSGTQRKHEILPSLKDALPTVKPLEKKTSNLQGEISNPPSNIRFPGEFEESQAVLVSIPSVALTRIGTFKGEEYNMWVEVFASSQYLAYFNVPPGYAIFIPYLYGLSEDPNEAYTVEHDKYLYAVNLGIFTNNNTGEIDTTIAHIWTNLINSIQQECTVWIRISNINDSTTVKDYMQKVNMPLKNYEFFSDGNGEDAFWARDWGPLGFYYGDQGKLAFVDAEYYPGRLFDDEFSKYLLNKKGYDYYNLPVHLEGGNIMGDGYKYITYSDVVYNNNSTNQGQIIYDASQQKWMQKQFTPLSKTQLDSKMKAAFGAEDVIVPQHLQYDGGTGHIDLYLKQFDEESMLITDMPSKYSKLTDYKIIQKNRDMLASKKTAFGTKYRFLNAPLPRLDNGEMPTSNDSLYSKDPRSYLNGVIVNKSYIYPCFSKKGEANYNYELEVQKTLKELLPGYKLCPIDARYLSPQGGAIHCITMQIPADHPITMRHKPVRDNISLTNSVAITVELVSNYDADNIALFWRKPSSSTWATVQLTADGKIYTGAIEGNFSENDTVQYYVAARKNNTIKKCLPYTAPDGYYTFYFGNTSIDQLYNYEPTSSSIASIYPNPATNAINVIFEVNNPGNINIEIFNSLGQVVNTPIQNKYFEKGVFTIDVANLNLPDGNYFIRMNSLTNNSMSSFVIMNK
ncbi:MAG: agmatine deiminase family protein [Bacteroidetes bacterium]|nr:agmatine deiminase family protein [Bacteroidota bacterium]